jgi:glycosyltransferase involved in cell wall biosynthesis
LGVASKWDHRKGLYDFIELCKSLDNSYAIILIGLSRQQINSLPKNIIGIARTENIMELVSFYNAADVYLNASIEETFGLTTIEAMACGTPAIVYNTTACPEVISADTGFIVEKKNLSGIIKAIETVKEKGKGYYSSACVQRVRKLYNKTDRYSDYLKLYNSLI